MPLDQRFTWPILWMTLPSLLIPLPALAARGKFSTAVNYGAGIAPVSVGVGDLNGDHKVDLAVADSASPTDSVSVLLGNGDGTFKAPVSYQLGACPQPPSSLALGDFNHDGKLDMVVVSLGDNCSAGSLYIFLGNGDGTFQPSVEYSGGGSFVAVGDFNNDGNLDAAAVGTGGVNISLGNGDDTFQQAYSVSTDSGFPFALAVGDFNGDGNLDMAVTEALNPVGVDVLLGNGNGTFQDLGTIGLTGVPDGIAAADFNQDGKLDLAVANAGFGANALNVLPGNGDGTFQAPVNYPAGSDPYFPVVSDFDGDGKLDVAVTNAGTSGAVSVLLGNGNGSFQSPATYPVGGDPNIIAAGDFNNDGAADLVASNASTNNASVLLNEGGTLIRAASAPNPSHVGQTVTFTATVRASRPGLPAPTGQVSFLIGRNTLGSAMLVNGRASFSARGLPAGNHQVTASYSGDSNFNPHQATPIIQRVLP